MKITTTQDRTVSFLQMTPALAMLLVDLASDLATGAQVLHPDGGRFVPSDRALEELRKVGDAYDRPTSALALGDRWDDYWTAAPITTPTERDAR
jgi:hypothetical protein